MFDEMKYRGKIMFHIITNRAFYCAYLRPDKLIKNFFDMRIRQ